MRGLYYIKTRLYHRYQSVYRKNHSTLTILIKLRNDIERAMKSGEVTLAVFVDFSEAYDTIDFHVLIHKMHLLHFSKNFLYLILNYLSNRSHFCTNRFNLQKLFIFKMFELCKCAKCPHFNSKFINKTEGRSNTAFSKLDS